ncbi:MAG: carboxymuconolactone decarboxylase family protein [Ekhidna sp.]
MKTLEVPAREEVSENNQAIFDNLKANIGFVPNLYASFAYSETALGDYLAFQNRKSSLRTKEREVINLVVSQVNECSYCLAAHTAIAKMNGFSDDEILEIRRGEVNFDDKIAALVNFVKDITVNRSKPGAASVEALYEAGYTSENMIDINMVIGDKMVSNFIYGAAQFPIDFPAAPELEEATA